MWDLVTRLFWLPLAVMQRVSQRVFHLGRAIYGGLFGGPAGKPAIKPESSSTPPSTTKSSSYPLCQPASTSTSMSSPKSSVSTTAVLLPNMSVTPCTSAHHLEIATTPCVVIDMEPSTIAASITTPEKSLPSTCSSADISKIIPSSLSTTEKTSVIQSAHLSNKDDLELTTTTARTDDVSANDLVHSLVSEQAVSESVVDEPAQVAVTINSEARAEKKHAQDFAGCTADAASIIDPIIRREKRCREIDERQQITQENVIDSCCVTVGGDDITSEITAQEEHGSAKKPKLSVETEDPSQLTLSCEDAVADSIKKNKKKRSKKNKKVIEIQKGLQGKEGRDTMGIGERPPPPNYFIAIQISNKDIISRVAQLQKSLTERDLSPPWHNLKNTEIFKDAMVPVAKLHFTLHVMHLKGEEDVRKAQNVLTECCSEIHQEFMDSPMDLTIEGLGHFRNNVIYAQIQDKLHIERLTKLSEMFRKKFNQLDISVDPRPFNPHMTIAKISRSNKLYKKKIRTFPPDIWSGHEQTNFGIQRVTGLQLLQMAGEDKATGYYVCHGQYSFEEPLVITTETSSDQ